MENNLKAPAKFGQDGILYVNRVSDIPTSAHAAVIQEESIEVPGYDRGDPSTTETIVKYIAFESDLVLEKWILAQDGKYGAREYRVIRVHPVTIKKQVTLELV